MSKQKFKHTKVLERSDLFAMTIHLEQIIDLIERKMAWNWKMSTIEVNLDILLKALRIKSR